MNPYEETRQAAKDGIARAAEGASKWKPFLARVIELTARQMPYLTADDVRDMMALFVPMDPPPFNLMALGAAMQAAQRDEIIESTDQISPSRRRTQHRERALWRSLVYRESDEFPIPVGPLDAPKAYAAAEM